ncbi:MAG: peptide-methionine (S)-S-oxide reductase MsrA [Patescibacteria group bacterium]
MKEKQLEKADFAAGCFWGVQADFDKLKGVKETTVGYEGGDFKNPTYEDVSSGKTGQAETIQIKYDPTEISYQDLLNAFWKMHNPTTLNRQGLNVGTNYRSVIFYHNEEQKILATKAIADLEHAGTYKKIVTEVVPAKEFWPAEEYHQKYYLKHKHLVC